MLNLLHDYKILRLRKRGLRIGRNVYIGHNVNIDSTHCNLITIGDNTVISNGCIILAHDASSRMPNGETRFAKVVIGRNCFLGVNTIVLCGVSIGDNSIVGAGSIVTRDVPNDCVFAGSPAKKIHSLSEFKTKYANFDTQ